jgi:hypothetical protein
VSLRDKIAAKGADLIDKKGAEGLDHLLAEGRTFLTEAGLPAEEAAEGAKVLDHIAKNKTPFLRLGQVGFTTLLTHWEDKDEAAARRYYLEFKATYEERNAAIANAGDKLVDAEDTEDAAWAEVKTVLVEAGTFGLAFLLKLGARVIGIPL